MTELNFSEEEIVSMFRSRSLNSKTNNLIVTEVRDLSFLKDIPDHCDVTLDRTLEDECCAFPVSSTALNVPVDLSIVRVKDIITHTLRKIGLLDKEDTIDFEGSVSAFKLHRKLQNRGLIVQIILYNIEDLDAEEQMLLNELIYFRSPYYNVNVFTKDQTLKTYFLTRERFLDRRESFMQMALKPIEEEMTSNNEARSTKEKSLEFKQVGKNTPK